MERSESCSAEDRLGVLLAVEEDSPMDSDSDRNNESSWDLLDPRGRFLGRRGRDADAAAGGATAEAANERRRRLDLGDKSSST